MIPAPENTAALDALVSTPTEGVLETVAQCEGDFAVLGAGGKMGYHLALMLKRALDKVGRKDRMVTVSRFGSPEIRARFENAGFDVVSADLSRPEEVAALPDVPNVFFLAGIKFGTAANTGLLEKMNIVMPRLVADRYRHARIVAFSSGCVYSFATPESGGSTEDSETDPPGEYARSCLGREQAFTEASAAHGTPCTLVRLNYAIDLRYGVLVDIAQSVLAGRPVNAGTGYVNVIWQGDAIAHIIQCLPHAASPPFVINVTAPGVIRVRDLAQAFAGRFGRDALIEGTEEPTAWLANPGKANQLFGQPQVSLEQLIDWTADWLRRGGETLDKPTHFENREGSY